MGQGFLEGKPGRGTTFEMQIKKMSIRGKNEEKKKMSCPLSQSLRPSLHLFTTESVPSVYPRGHGGLCVHRPALGETGMVNTPGCFFKGRNAIPTIYPEGQQIVSEVCYQRQQRGHQVINESTARLLRRRTGILFSPLRADLCVFNSPGSLVFSGYEDICALNTLLLREICAYFPVHDVLSQSPPKQCSPICAVLKYAWNKPLRVKLEPSQATTSSNPTPPPQSHSLKFVKVLRDLLHFCFLILAFKVLFLLNFISSYFDSFFA